MSRELPPESRALTGVWMPQKQQAPLKVDRCLGHLPAGRLGYLMDELECGLVPSVPQGAADKGSDV